MYSCRQMYEDIKPNKRMAARSAAILLLGFAFVLTQSTADIKQIKKGRRFAPPLFYLFCKAFSSRKITIKPLF
jgi:hypothetical protein